MVGMQLIVVLMRMRKKHDIDDDLEMRQSMFFFFLEDRYVGDIYIVGAANSAFSSPRIFVAECTTATVSCCYEIINCLSVYCFSS